MSEAIVFRTPGLIDIRAFTTMGLSAKPNSSSPIGYFGTGLKYAVATMVRLGAQPVVWIGKDKYTFSKRPTEFRGKDFELIGMKRQKWSLTKASHHDLPFTTEYGKNWKPWMAFRELEANTRDENGETACIDRPDMFDLDMGGPDTDHTCIVIEHPEFVESWKNKGEIFLEGGLRGPTDECPRMQILPGDNKFLYWRGLKVKELVRPTLNTYNFLGYLELTEDRTLAYEFYARNMLGEALVEMNDERLIERVLTAEDGAWEHDLELPKYSKPSRAFRRVMYTASPRLSPSAFTYFARHDDRPKLETADLLKAHPVPWKFEDTAVFDADGNVVFDEPHGYRGSWKATALEIIRRLGVGTGDTQ